VPRATIYYRDIGDYLTREQKLARVRECGSAGAMLKTGAFAVLKPNRHGDWIFYRDEGYAELIPSRRNGSSIPRSKSCSQGKRHRQ
jgi:predicted helicase